MTALAEQTFLTIGETAEVLRVSDDLVSDLIAQGLLPAAALGRRKVVPRIAIDQIVDVLLADFDPAAVAARLAAAVPAKDNEFLAATGTTGPTSAHGAAPPHGASPPTPLRGLRSTS